MDKVSAEELSKHTKSQEKPGEGIELKKEQQANPIVTGKQIGRAHV